MYVISENRTRPRTAVLLFALFGFMLASVGNAMGPPWVLGAAVLLYLALAGVAAYAHYCVRPMPARRRRRLRIAAAIVAWVLMGILLSGMRYPINLRTDRRISPLPELIVNSTLGGLIAFVVVGVSGRIADVLFDRYRSFPGTGYCETCGYDLRGLDGRRCPECGNDSQAGAPQE